MRSDVISEYPLSRIAAWLKRKGTSVTFAGFAGLFASASSSPGLIPPERRAAPPPRLPL